MHSCAAIREDHSDCNRDIAVDTVNLAKLSDHSRTKPGGVFQRTCVLGRTYVRQTRCTSRLRPGRRKNVAKTSSISHRAAAGTSAHRLLRGPAPKTHLKPRTIRPAPFPRPSHPTPSSGPSCPPAPSQIYRTGKHRPIFSRSTHAPQTFLEPPSLTVTVGAWLRTTDVRHSACIPGHCGRSIRLARQQTATERVHHARHKGVLCANLVEGLRCTWGVSRAAARPCIRGRATNLRAARVC